MLNHKNYFDYAAATPMLPEVIKAMQPFFSNQFHNPSALYLAARNNRLVLEEARATISRCLGARPTEIVFTAGGTEANNLAINGVMQADSGSNMVISAIEHDSVYEPAKQYQCSYAKVDNKGLINLDHLKQLINDKTALVSVIYASNEIGTLQPIREISEFVKQVRAERSKKSIKTPIYLHTDACQAANYLDLQVAKLGIDLLTINSGKVYGPKQCGALYVRTGVHLKPQILGGGQERGLRSGTENLANIVGFATALKIVRQDCHTEAKRLTLLRDKFINIISSSLPIAIINGPVGNKRLANNIHLSMSGFDNERLLMMLDEVRYMVATGSACSAANTKPSRVLEAMGVSSELAQNSLRITPGRFTTEKSIISLANTLVKICQK